MSIRSIVFVNISNYHLKARQLNGNHDGYTQTISGDVGCLTGPL